MLLPVAPAGVTYARNGLLWHAAQLVIRRCIPDGMCVECEDQPASVSCTVCEDDFCDVCFQVPQLRSCIFTSPSLCEFSS